jgi:hypothetical protein
MNAWQISLHRVVHLQFFIQLLHNNMKGKIYVEYSCDSFINVFFQVMKKSELVQKNMVAQAIAERNAMALNR